MILMWIRCGHYLSGGGWGGGGGNGQERSLLFTCIQAVKQHFFLDECICVLFAVDNTKITLQLTSPKDSTKTGELKIALTGSIERSKKRSAGNCFFILIVFMLR